MGRDLHRDTQVDACLLPGGLGFTLVLLPGMGFQLRLNVRR